MTGTVPVRRHADFCPIPPASAPLGPFCLGPGSDLQGQITSDGHPDQRCRCPSSRNRGAIPPAGPGVAPGSSRGRLHLHRPEADPRPRSAPLQSGPAPVFRSSSWQLRFSHHQVRPPIAVSRQRPAPAVPESLRRTGESPVSVLAQQSRPASLRRHRVPQVEPVLRQQDPSAPVIRVCHCDAEDRCQLSLVRGSGP